MKLFANLRRRLFSWRINREIYFKIFPHLNGHADYGYPFSSNDELEKSHMKGFYEMCKTIEKINLAAARMPKAEGDAFRFIAARDLNERLRMHLKFAKSREYAYEPQEGSQAVTAAT